jgi:hypothetical protein
MSRNRITVSASPDAVFAVLDDPRAYPRWVVGTRRFRRVDPEWPDDGSRFHHAIGVPGAELQDSTKVVDRDPPHRVALDVRIRPIGTLRVDIEVTAADGGSEITIAEWPSTGPVARLPRVVTEPMLHLRNAWSLQRLRSEVEQRDRSAS